MSANLPLSWVSATLADLGIEVRGQVVPQPGTIYDLYSVPAFPIQRPERIDGSAIKSGKRPVAPGDVLLCKINPRINRVWAVDESEGQPQLASTEYMVLRPHERAMGPFIRQFLSSPSFRRWIELSVEGATGSHTRAKSGPILNQRVPVAPLEEQKRIVTAVEEYFSRLDAAEATLRSAERRCLALTKSVVINAIPQEAPADWQVKSVADAGETGLGRQRSPKYHSGTNMKPYLRVANVFEDRIDATDVMQMHFDEADFEKFRLRSGDVLLNEGQSPELLGRPAIYRGEPSDVAFTNSLIRFVPKPGVTSEWALLVFRRHMHAGRFQQESRITTNIAHLALGRFRTVEFPVPPLEVQQEVVASTRLTLDAVDRQVDQIDREIAAIRSLRRSVLAAAFSGRLVPQDPEDEPASVLLERIAASRLAKPAHRRRTA